MAYIDAHRDRFEVEPICRALQFAPSTYWSAKRRARSARSKRDDALSIGWPRHVVDEWLANRPPAGA